MNFSPGNFQRPLLKFNKFGCKFTVPHVTEWFLLVDSLVFGIAPFLVNNKENNALAKWNIWK